MPRLSRVRVWVIGSAAVIGGSQLMLAQSVSSAARLSAKPTIANYLSPQFPLGVPATAKKAERVAWIGYDKGQRNVWTAVAPDFKPVRLTAFMADDGTDMDEISISDSGSIIVFVRGTEPNRAGWNANPSHDPNGAERAIWAVRSTGGPAWRLAVGNAPALSPDGKYVLFVRDSQIYHVRLFPEPTTPVDKGDAPFIKEWGRQSNPQWSPDGSKIAFVSDRSDHAFIGIYDLKTKTVSYFAPSTDRDGSPTWSSDGKRIAFTRRPGTPFGAQSQAGGGGIGLPPGPAAAAAAAALAGRGGRGGRGGGGGAAAVAAAPACPGAGGAGGGGRGARGGGGGGGGRGGRGNRGGGAAAGDSAARAAAPDTGAMSLCNSPGLYRATFKGGYSLELMIGDLATGTAHELWHPGPAEVNGANINAMRWEGDNLVFQGGQSGRGGGGGGGGFGGGAAAGDLLQAPPASGPQNTPITGNDESARYFSINVVNPKPEPVMLTTTNGLIEDATSVAYSKDGKTMFYCTNAGDVEHRHIWMVPTAGGTPKEISEGDGIETSPMAFASGKRLAVFYADAKTPETIAIMPIETGKAKTIVPLPKEFPADAHVVPEVVLTKAADSVTIHNQLFLPKDLKPGERRPAIVFVHGGPVREMLPGYHYMQFYHEAYGVNEWFANQGYIVISINYRSGIGYGRAFRSAPNVGTRGNAEYQDVLAGIQYLRSRPDVDPKRIGMWGLSYGGDLTSQALARNSDLIVAGADLAGVHLWGSSLDPSDVSYQSSTISAIDKWTSPVFLEQGDDDRNVEFAQMIGLVDLLRERNVYYELLINPDETHELLVHSEWVNTFTRMGNFLERFVGNAEKPPVATGSGK